MKAWSWTRVHTHLSYCVLRHGGFSSHKMTQTWLNSDCLPSPTPAGGLTRLCGRGGAGQAPPPPLC